MVTAVTPTRHVSVNRRDDGTILTIQASPPARSVDILLIFLASFLLLVGGLVAFFGALNMRHTGLTPVYSGLGLLALCGLIFFRVGRRLRSKSGYDLHLDQAGLSDGKKVYDIEHIGDVRLKDSMGKVFFNARDAREARLKTSMIESGRAARGWEIEILYGDAWITLLAGLSRDAGEAAMRQLVAEMQNFGWRGVNG